jgi:hypothetical protein
MDDTVWKKLCLDGKMVIKSIIEELVENVRIGFYLMRIVSKNGLF